MKLKFSDDGKYLMSLDRSGLLNIRRLSDGGIWRRLRLPGGICDADILFAISCCHR